MNSISQLPAEEIPEVIYEADLLKDGFVLLDRSPWLYKALPPKYYWFYGKYMYVVGPDIAEKFLVIDKKKEQQHAATNAGNHCNQLSVAG